MLGIRKLKMSLEILVAGERNLGSGKELPLDPFLKRWVQSLWTFFDYKGFARTSYKQLIGHGWLANFLKRREESESREDPIFSKLLQQTIQQHVKAQYWVGGVSRCEFEAPLHKFSDPWSNFGAMWNKFEIIQEHFEDPYGKFWSPVNLLKLRVNTA